MLVALFFAGPCDVVDGDAAEGSAPQAPAERFVSVEVSNGFGCALRDDGLVRCWGDGPASVAPEGEFSAISAGTDVVCGIRVGGEIDCWGTDDEDLLTPPIGEFSSLDIGYAEACGVRVDGGLACWGSSGRAAVPEGGFRAVAAYGFEATCGIRVDGAVVCWGDSSERWVPPEGSFRSLGVVSNYGCGVRESGEVACWGSRSRWCKVDDTAAVVCSFLFGGNDGENGDGGRDSPLDGVVVDVAVNESFLCGIRDDGEVACRGVEKDQRCHPHGAYGTCSGWGNDPIPPGPFVSIDVPPGDPYGTRASRAPICGLRPDGRVDCWNDGSQRLRPPAGKFVAVDVGGAMCAVGVEGAAACWGRVDWSDSVPGGAFTAVSGSHAHGCGLRPGGEAECWGSNGWGEATARPGRFAAIDVGPSLSCGLRLEGEVACWGRNTSGEAEPPEGPFVAIDVGWMSACGLRADGTAECWGDVRAVDGTEAAGVFAAPDFSDPEWGDSFPGGTFETIRAAGRIACGIRPDGTIECWSPDWPPGAGAPVPAAEGRLGREPRVGMPAALVWVQGAVSGGPFAALSSGIVDTCGLRPDATVACWSDGMREQVGTFSSPTGTFDSIDVGWRWACGSGTDGRRRCWAPSAMGPTEPVDMTPIAPDEEVLETQRGSRVHCSLLAGGDIACWDFSVGTTERRAGPFARFSVGWGIVTDPNAPREMDPLFAPGNDWYTGEPSEENTHVCAIRRDGSLECWGSNRSGQTRLPAPWLDDPPYSDIAAGFAHTCAIGAGGEIVCWGDNRYDQTQSPPGEFTALSAGFWHTCGLRPDGEITCWGNGAADFDLAYDAPPLDRPTEPPPGPFTAIAAGFWHTCALRPDGSVTCWLSY